MKVYHVSDTHGYCFWKHDLTDIDLVIHSGDLFPNCSRGLVDLETPFQRDWIEARADAIEAWLDGRPLFYVPGNHDYVELDDYCRAVRINDRPYTFNGLTFAGHREIPYIYGEWNGEVRSPEMAEIVRKTFEGKPDVLITHTPPAGILAKEYGCNHLLSYLDYGEHNVKAHFFGHVHLNKAAYATSRNTLFSNAAIAWDRSNLPDTWGHNVTI